MNSTTSLVASLKTHVLFRVVATLCLATSTTLAAEPLGYNRDIRPLLSDNCFPCHGPDAANRQAGLRLDLRQKAILSADSGDTAIVPGKPDSSQLVTRIYSNDPDLIMPPPEAGYALSDSEKELLHRWIASGAEYQNHWAFEPIRTSTYTGDPIDFFVRAKLVQIGLAPNPPAKPEKLLRRICLDLTGLPATIDETDAFLLDVQRRGIDLAYADVVDRLLQSPRYGERMAWQWLEAARYADTDGYQNDGPREMWRWRDWVINAYNKNMPFDQFTMEQLAGDLLPTPTHEQILATAFNRNNRYNSEEGIPIDEFLLENAVDRVDTTATVWMGMTFGCARCHDHKFDPISQKEYYQLIDYFNDVAESGRAVKFGNSEPWIKSPTNSQRETLKDLQRKLNRARRSLKNAEPELELAQQNWEVASQPQTRFLTNGLDFYYDFDDVDQRVLSRGIGASLDTGPRGRAATVTDTGYFETEKIPGLIGNGRFSIAFWMNPTQVDTGPILSNEIDGTGRSGILIEFVDGHLRWNINTRWISGVSTIETLATFNAGNWVHIALTNDGTQRADGMRIYVDGQLQSTKIIRNTNSNAAARSQGAPMRIGYSKHLGFWQGQIDELRFYTNRTLNDSEAALLAEPVTVETIANIPSNSRTPRQRELLRQTFLEQSTDAEYSRLLNAKQEAESALVQFEDSLPTTMIMRDTVGGRPSFVRKRGVYDALGEQVHAGVPNVFPPLPTNMNNNRLAFARWLVAPDHPLTARVAVNRYWQLLFGRGFVDTPEDFGSQGSLPSHPELLDVLAAELIEDRWDMKALMKRIVLSETYRQDSSLRADHLRLDPKNAFLARVERVRLPGNVLRDQALWAAGLLVEELGGPSVFPYQPAGLWKEASNATYKVGTGKDLYRRSLYTYWKRTLAPPSMAVLDTGDREYCTVKPKRTNTPLQALTLLNDTTFIEAARKLAESILLAGGESDEARVRFAFRTVTMREPTPEERQLLTAALNDYRTEFHSNPRAAKTIVQVGDFAPPPSLSKSNHKGIGSLTPRISDKELAATIALANVLLNLDEVTTRE